nr:tRNA epoxyqueuosine(34) reductase QueG [Parvularcula oceani]
MATTTRTSSPGARDREARREDIRAEAKALGFDACGFAAAALPEAARDGLNAFLAQGFHGEMSWMETRTEQRASPTGLWGDARSVIALGMSYGPDEDPMAMLARRTVGNISVYARNRDYHDVVKKRLKQLGRWMAERFGCELKVFVDTAPVMEKPLGQQAGIGWQGKHTNLVSREHGSWLFLGCIYTTLDLPPDPAHDDRCGSCRACQDVCPTDAFPAPYKLDATRCISYLTIEHAGPVPREFREALGNRIYGCDDCLAVCPWNKFAGEASEAKLRAREDLKAPSLAHLSGLDDPAFRSLFSGSPIKRIGRDRFVRNVCYAIGNSGEPALRDALRPRLEDESALVRGAAVWAWRRLEGPAGPLERMQREEPEPEVRRELFAS